jgi:hypothetical protein
MAFSCGPKGRFHPLSARIPVATSDSTPRRPVLSLRTRTPGCYPAWRQVSGPCVLGIVGLAIAVVLWGYGYKLSLYHRNSDPSGRVPVAKLWIEPRGASVAAASSIKAISNFVAGSQASVATVPPLPSMSRTLACILPRCEHRTILSDSLVPSRAPPPLRLRLA